MSFFDLITWNMQGANESKWTLILRQNAGIKLLQECATPLPQFTDEFGTPFGITPERSARLSYGAFGEEKKNKNANNDNMEEEKTKDVEITAKIIKKKSKADEIIIPKRFMPHRKPRITNKSFQIDSPMALDFGATRGQLLYVTKFAPYGQELQKKCQNNREEIFQELIDNGIKSKMLEEGFDFDESKAAVVKNEQDELLRSFQRATDRMKNLASPFDSNTKHYRYSRCNMAIAYRPSNLESRDISHLDELAPAKPEFQRYVQCIKMTVEHAVFIIFNIHSVASGGAWAYFRYFLPRFDAIARDNGAVAWVCVGDFNLDATIMEEKLAVYFNVTEVVYPFARVVHTGDVHTHFSKKPQPEVDDTKDDDDPEFIKSDRTTVSRLIEESSPKLKTEYNGVNLDYMVISTPIEMPDLKIEREALTSGFLSDHRPVAFTIPLAQFDPIALWIADERSKRMAPEEPNQMRKEG